MCKHQEIIKVLRMIQTLLQSLGQPPVMFGVSLSNSSTEIEQPSDIYLAYLRVGTDLASGPLHLERRILCKGFLC